MDRRLPGNLDLLRDEVFPVDRAGDDKKKDGIGDIDGVEKKPIMVLVRFWEKRFEMVSLQCLGSKDRGAPARGVELLRALKDEISEVLRVRKITKLPPELDARIKNLVAKIEEKTKG